MDSFYGQETSDTWHRDLEAETKRMGYTWGQLAKLAQDQDAWRTLAGCLAGAKSNGDDDYGGYL